jgi:hypothetical protein
MIGALDNFERFLHDQYGYTPPVIKAGLAHAASAVVLRELFETDQRRVARLGRAAGSALQVFELLRDRIALSIPRALVCMRTTGRCEFSVMGLEQPDEGGPGLRNRP